MLSAAMLAAFTLTVMFAYPDFLLLTFQMGICGLRMIWGSFTRFLATLFLLVVVAPIWFMATTLMLLVITVWGIIAWLIAGYRNWQFARRERALERELDAWLDIDLRY